jgi:hypothetical protein
MNRIVRLTNSHLQKHPKVFAAFLLVIASLLVFSCKKNDGEFVLGSDFLESSSDIRRVDTFSVELSTVIIDSFPTNNYSIAMVGYFDDAFYGADNELGYGNMLGQVKCNSFFQLGTPEYYEVLEDDIYDSVKFILSHTGYTYGDTLQPLVVSLYPLSKALDVDEKGYIYSSTSVGVLNNNSLDCSLTRGIPNNLIGTITYRPQPHSYKDDSVEVRVNDTIGLRLFNLMLNSSDTVNSDNIFQDYINGIAMVTDTSVSKVIANYDVSRLKLRVYYHRFSSDKEDLTADFPVTNTSYQYNMIKHYFDGSNVSQVKTQREAIPSSAMENSSFIYGGVGLMTRVRFPTMPDFLLIKNSFLVKAELDFKPKLGTFSEYKLPTEIMMYSTNARNDLGTIFYNSDGTTISSASFYEDPYDDETYYSIDLTSFMTNELSDNYFDVNNGILLSNLPSNFIKSFERLILDSNKPVLKIYYVTY